MTARRAVLLALDLVKIHRNGETALFPDLILGKNLRFPPK
jgi:hypothetical protein